VKPKLPLAMRTHRCDVCALVIDRDTNAANLAARGE
jgi:transposase